MLEYADHKGYAGNGVVAENALVGTASPRMQRRRGDPAEKTTHLIGVEAPLPGNVEKAAECGRR
jgi:hypothetical protein